MPEELQLINSFLDPIIPTRILHNNESVFMWETKNARTPFPAIKWSVGLWEASLEQHTADLH